jgi:5-formyltetrahydrofolate cyclo-ligase
MIKDKSYLRKKFILLRKKNHSKAKKFNFSLIFKLIKKNFLSKKINIACYYPSNYEVNILKFIQQASKKNFKVSLPVIRSLGKMSFKHWCYKDPLYLSKFGTLEPLNTNKEIIPDLVIVPLAAYDNQLNRIGYGKGYYDRILEKINRIKKKTIFLGIAYSFQKYHKIPINKHDIKLDYIFTEKGIIKQK